MDGSLKVRNWLADGIFPDKLLYDKFKWLKKFKEDIVGGMRPERWLLERSRVSNPCSAPIFFGIFPVK